MRLVRLTVAVAAVAVAFAGLCAAALAAPSWTAYVANPGSNNVTPISTATNTAGSAITVGTRPSGVIATPTGFEPTGIALPAVLVAVEIGVTLPLPVLVT